MRGNLFKCQYFLICSPHETPLQGSSSPILRIRIWSIKNHQNPGWWVLGFLCIGDFDADDDIDHQKIGFLAIGDKFRPNCSAIKFASMCLK